MTPSGRALALGAGPLVAVLLALPAALRAQQPQAPPPARTDTLARRDSAARADSTPRPPGLGRDTVPLPDSLSPDSFAAVLPPLGPPAGPLPPGGRVVFDRDALIFSGAFTLGELLMQVPGVFLTRVGWYGFPETVHYAGQGASSVELFWDGYAVDPLGEDSTGAHLERIPLGMLRRVEVEVLPTVLRVHLVSDTQPVLRARTETSFATGDGQTNSYRIRYLNRWRSGAGVGLGVNWFGTSGMLTVPAASSDLSVWGKASWAPTPRLGFDAQLVRYSLERDSLRGLLPERRVHRTDVMLRAHASSRDDGAGWRVDALLGSSSYGDSSGAIDSRIAQAAAFAGYRAARWSWEAGVRFRDDRIPLELTARASATPLAVLTVSAFGRWRSLLGDRTSTELGAGASLRPFGPLVVRGAVRHRDGPAAPAFLGDTAQIASDWSGSLGITTRRVELEAGIERHAAWSAPAYQVYSRLVPGGTSVAVTTATARFALRAARGLTLWGWYRHPLEDLTAAYEPPHHSRVALTLRSKFLPKFRRGALDVLVQVGAEAWSDGVMGTDSLGSRVGLDGHGTFDWLVEVRLLGAVIYWTLRNAQNERYELVPGGEMTRSRQRYGVRWEFTN